MQHRCFEFKIVKTRSGWMWVVEVGKTEKVVGTHRDRDGAVRRAKALIDDLVSEQEQKGHKANECSGHLVNWNWICPGLRRARILAARSAKGSRRPRWPR